MTAREAVLEAARLIGVYEKVRAYIEEGREDGKTETDVLLKCFNLVENELALEYFPLLCEDEVESDTGKIDYYALSNQVVRVIKVADCYGNEAAFKLFPEYIKTAAGKVKITYSYTPKQKFLDDEGSYITAKVSVRMMAYGIAAEYCLACGLYEEAAVWDKKYKDCISAAYKGCTSRVLKSRRWV